MIMLGHWELLLVGLVILLLFVGPKKLPSFGKSLGESIRGFKKAIKEEEEALDITESTQVEQITETERKEKSTSNPQKKRNK